MSGSSRDLCGLSAGAAGGRAGRRYRWQDGALFRRLERIGRARAGGETVSAHLQTGQVMLSAPSEQGFRSTLAQLEKWKAGRCPLRAAYFDPGIAEGPLRRGAAVAGEFCATFVAPEQRAYDPTAAAEPPAAVKARAFITEHLGEPLLNQVAHAANMSAFISARSSRPPRALRSPTTLPGRGSKRPSSFSSIHMCGSARLPTRPVSNRCRNSTESSAASWGRRRRRIGSTCTARSPRPVPAMRWRLPPDGLARNAQHQPSQAEPPCRPPPSLVVRLQPPPLNPLPRHGHRPAYPDHQPLPRLHLCPFLPARTRPGTPLQRRARFAPAPGRGGLPSGTSAASCGTDPPAAGHPGRFRPP